MVLNGLTLIFGVPQHTCSYILYVRVYHANTHTHTHTHTQQLVIRSQHQASTSTPLTLAPLPPPPPSESNLPRNWRTARDPQGKMYYYHVITRKSQWEPPTDQDVEGTITMDLATPEHEPPSDEVGV